MAEYNWDDINGTAVERLRAPKTAPVPAAIVAQAQRSVDGDPASLVKTGAFHFSFGDHGKGEAFARFMKRAGAHTKPPSSMSVVVGVLEGEGALAYVRKLRTDEPDPEELAVGWKAGKRRGKAVA